MDEEPRTMTLFTRFARRSAPLAGLLALLLLAGDAFAGPKAAVARDIGGKASPGYKKPSSLKLRKPWRLKKSSKDAPGEGASISLRGRSGYAVDYLTAPHYASVRNSALQLMRNHKPDKHFYIALGRSPGAMAAFLAELNPHMVMTFPASDLRLGVQPGWKQAFFDHFEQLIPDDVLNGERTAVFFDRSHDRSGTSLSKMQELLTEYLQIRNGKKIAVKAVGLANYGPLVGEVEHQSTLEEPSTFQYFSGQDNDEEFAPFLDKHRIGTEPIENVKENPNHGRMRDALRERMAHDKDLRKMLREDFGDFIDGDD
jgi:hypothetical protein